MENNFGSLVSDKQMFTRVNIFLHTLSYKRREVLILRIWNNLSYTDIESITGQKIKTSKKIVSRAQGNAIDMKDITPEIVPD
jgi:DNA-directed RNA polymerase specialized sigma24 family protein